MKYGEGFILKWIKHDTDANMDAKLQEVLLDYGLEGYGLYWYCIELIAGKVSKDNITFELEHDARVIARNTGSTVQKVEEMMRRFVELDLFEVNAGRVRCMKLANRLDKSMTSNPEMRAIIEQIKSSHDSIMINHDSVMQEESRLDKTRLEEKHISSSSPKVTPCPYQEIVDAYNSQLTQLPRVAALSETRKKALKARWREDKERQTIDWWVDFFAWIASSNKFLLGADGDWQANFDWIIKQANFIKIIEGNYRDKANG